MNSIQRLSRLCVNLLKIVATNPRRLKFVMGTTLAATDMVSDRALDLLRLRQVRVEDLLPDSGTDLRACLALIPKTNASVSVLEFVTLILLLKKAKASSVFEFGTYKGVSTTQLALNVSTGGRVYTLDLPDDTPDTQYPISSFKDARIALEKGKGSLVPPDLRGRIEFLKQDSAKFDESPFAQSIDFVFVDGAHNFEYVRNDSEKGWRMLRPGGIIAWHDCCPGDPDVIRFLLGSSYAPACVQGTSLAFAVKP